MDLLDETVSKRSKEDENGREKISSNGLREIPLWMNNSSLLFNNE